jgi:valyl-tRNA synthetase
MLAPVLPYITEEVWSWAFAKENDIDSIHRAPWPKPGDFSDVSEPESEVSFSVAVDALAAIHKQKTLSQQSAGARISSLLLVAHPETIAVLGLVADDVMAGARVESYELESDESIEEGVFEVRSVEFA